LSVNEDENRDLLTQCAEAFMTIGPAPQPPVEFPFALSDWQIIDAGNAPAHQTILVEFPILVTVTAELIAAVVVPLVGKAYRNAVFERCP
jgi:hypothetical protein